jgi:hypothetical protein
METISDLVGHSALRHHRWNSGEAAVTNPWTTDVETAGEDDAVAETAELEALAPAVAGPQAGAVAVPSDTLPRRVIEPRSPETLFLVGAHGGAGETTLEQLLQDAAATGHAWPTLVQPAARPRGLLVARTHAHGLRCAQRAATEWAAGAVDIELVGLVLVADAPGRLPRALRDLAELVAGGVPQVWWLPWVEAWRQGEPVALNTSPKPVVRALQQIASAASISRTTTKE